MPDKSIVELLSEHYQKTFEVIYNFWKHRSKSFLMLLVLCGIEILLVFRTQQIINVFNDAYNKFLVFLFLQRRLLTGL